MSLVHLVRHGEPLNGWGQPGGDPDPGLTETGWRQAQAAAHILGACAGPPARVLTSPLRRCRETAAPYAARLGVEPQVEGAVAEIVGPMGAAPGRAEWLRDAMAGEWAAIPGIDGAAWREAVVRALLRAEGAAVFTHFVAINAAVSAAQGTDAVLAFRPAPGSVTTLRIDGGRLRMERLGAALDEAGRVL